MRGIYVKLPNNTWIKVKGKLGGIIAGKSGKRAGYTLIAESINKIHKNKSKPDIVFHISSTKVTKYIYRLLDKKLDSKLKIIIEYVRPEIYKVEVYGKEFKEAYKIAEEMGIVRKVKV